MTAVARLAASFAVATLALGWAAGANAVDVLPAGSNASSAPAAQSFTVLNPFSRIAGVTTNYNYGKTTAGDPTADQNAYADLNPLFAFDVIAPFAANAGDAPVMVKRTLEATPPAGSQTPVEQIPGGFGVVDVYTFQALGPLSVHAQVAGPDAIAPGGGAFENFTLSLFRRDLGGDGIWDVAGGAVSGDTTLLGSGAGADMAALASNLTDPFGLYAVVVQAVTPDTGLYNKVDYELALRFGELVDSINEVPLPAAFWLLISGLVGLFGFARARRASAA